MFLHIFVVGHAVFGHWTGNEVLQFIFVPFVEDFELVVNVYSDIGKCVLLLRIYLARVTVTMQCRRTEQIKESYLELALLACQHKAGVVTALAVVHCIGNHCHKPFGEIQQPLLGVADNHTTCQIGNSFQ